jgi:hypothetical protein
MSEDREDKHERSGGSLDQDEMNSFLEGRRGREFESPPLLPSKKEFISTCSREPPLLSCLPSPSSDVFRSP